MLQINHTVKRISYFLLIVSLLITSFQIQPNKIVAEPLGADVTSILTNLLVNVTQGGLTISEGGEFSSDPIAVEISFGVPVEGDLPVPTEIVKKGDYALFTIEGFSITGDSSTIDLISNGIKLGTLEFSSVGENTQIKVVFDGEDEVFNGDFSEVSATFNANLEYVGNEQGSEDESYIVTILGKTFTVNVPAIPKVYTGVKTGVKRGDEIDWKVKVEVTQGEQNISISGLKLVDDLINVGALIGDFSYNSVDDRTSATPFNPTFVLKEGSKYTLEFPEGVVSPVYVFFSTKIAEDFVTNGTKTITNTARLFDGEVEKVVVSDSVSFENRWIDKSSSNPEYIMEGGKLVAYVTWFITVNHMGASLPNARIIDVLDPKLQFVESEWYKKSGDNWVSLGSVNTVRPLGDTYFYPEPILNENIQLRVRTRVNPDENIGHKVISISNSARLEWGLDGEEQGVGSGSINVGIGTNPISKSVGNYDVKNHTIPWTVTVQQSDVSVSLRVLDLLVYGSTFDYGNVHSIEKALGAGSGLEDINKSHLDSIQNSLSPSFRQKYKPGSFTNSQGLTHTVYTLKDEDGIAIADLLVVSEGGNTINVSGGTLENPQSKSFNFETVVTDPTWYLSNSNRTVANTAMLFSANIKLNQRTANRSIAPRALFKDMLKADASVDPLNRKSDRTTNLTEGFNYEDKSVVFRLFVNQNGINATGGITTVDGQVVGNITIEDTLPSGWEFVDIEEDVKFYLFNASGTPNSMTVGNQIISYENFLTSDFNTAGKATFTFTTLEEAYVIFVKARPTDATLDVYFNDNKTTTVTNTLRMTANEGVSVSDTQQVRIISQVVEKNMVKVENGVLRWTVSYRPFDIFQNIQDLDQYRLIDMLPIGLELYTDAFGNLDFSSGNFTVTEMVLTPTGYVASGPVFTVEQMQAAISYDFATRKLIFVIPNKDTSYQLNYKTMVTANSGSLTNSVVLEGVSLNSTNTSSSYIVATADASATMTRNGWVEVDKSNQNSSKLSGSEFTVFTEDSSLALRKGLTDSQGRLVLRGLPIGNYVLKETSAPTGYIVSEREYLVTVRNESGTIVTSIDGKTGTDANKISVVNYQLGTSGDITVSKKVTGNDADVEKAFEFTLTITGVSGDREFVKTSANGSVSFGSVIFNNGVSSFTIKHNESITIIGLPKDANYTLVEQVGDDYRAGYSVNSGTVQEGKTYSGVIVVDSEEKIEFTNQRVGLIEIKKVDSLTGDVLEGVEFELYLGDMRVSSAITDVDGIVRFSNLELNTYRLVESKPLPGYLPFEDEIEIVIDKTKLLVQMTVSNVAKKSEISLDKSMFIYNGDQVKANQNAVDSLSDWIMYKVVLKNTGDITLHNVGIVDDKEGLYDIEYKVLNSLGVEIDQVVINGQVTLQPNESLVMTAKLDVTQEILDEGSIFNQAFGTAYPEDPNEPGEPGEEVLEENDEILIDVDQKVMITLEKTSIDVEFFDSINKRIYYLFKIVNAGNTTLTDVMLLDDKIVEFTEFKLNGTIVDASEEGFTLNSEDVLEIIGYTVTTQEDIERGFIYNEAEVVGTDIFEEEVSDTDNDTVVGRKYNSVSLNKTNVIYNESDEIVGQYSSVTDVIVYNIKAVNTGNTIAYDVNVLDKMFVKMTGIVVTHLAANNTVISTFDYEGEMAITLLPGEQIVVVGNYQITEEDLLNERVFNQATAVFNDVDGEVLGDSEDETVSIGLVNLSVKKVDESDTSVVLSGAQFELRNVVTDQKWKITTNDKGIALFGKLEFGQYELREIVAPKGYVLSDEVMVIVIDEDSDSLIEIEFANEAMLPETSDSSTHSGLLLLFLGLLLVQFSGKSSKKKTQV